MSQTVIDPMGYGTVIRSAFSGTAFARAIVFSQKVKKSGLRVNGGMNVRKSAT
jgi:hypothetical protein